MAESGITGWHRMDSTSLVSLSIPRLTDDDMAEAIQAMVWVAKGDHE
jgi:hypothetical protein